MATEVKIGLYIGRFQPFHKGHQDVIYQMAKDPEINELIIGIGSSQYDHYFGNPFTWEERAEMIKTSLLIAKPYQIIPIPDIHDFPKWVPHVESLCPKFDVIYSGNTVVKRLFEEKGVKVVEPVVSHPISATLIRNNMVSNRDFLQMLPIGTIETLAEIYGITRVQQLHDKHARANVTSDLILPYKDGGFVFIERAHEPFSGMLAIAGGFLEVGFETTKQTAIREAKEEMGVDLDPAKVKYLSVYDDPQRDPRGPTIAHVYYYNEPYQGEIKAADDAKAFYILKKEEIPDVMAFDHKQIIDDYLERVDVK